MSGVYEFRRIVPVKVFDLVDRFARDRGDQGPRPRPIGEVQFQAVAEVRGGTRVSLPAPVELLVRRNTGGYHVFFGRTRGPNGAVRETALGAGTWVVAVSAPSYQPAEHEVALPDAAPLTIALEPGYAYPFPVTSTAPLATGGAGPAAVIHGLTLLRGAVCDTGGGGVAGATVEVVGVTPAYRTDPSGQWVLVFPDTPPSGPVTVRITLPDPRVVTVPGVAVEQGRDRTLAQTALTGRVQTVGGAGVAGAAVRIDGRSGEAVTAADGSWTYHFGLDQVEATVDLTVTLADGRSQGRAGVAVQPHVTTPVDPLVLPAA